MTVYFFHFPPTSNHLHPLQVENCDSNSRFVVDEDDNGKFRLAKVKQKYFSSMRVKPVTPLSMLSDTGILKLLVGWSPGPGKVTLLQCWFNAGPFHIRNEHRVFPGSDFS